MQSEHESDTEREGMAVGSHMLFEQRSHAVTGEEPETAIADTETDPELIGPEPGQAVFLLRFLINRVGAQEEVGLGDGRDP